MSDTIELLIPVTAPYTHEARAVFSASATFRQTTISNSVLVAKDKRHQVLYRMVEGKLYHSATQIKFQDGTFIYLQSRNSLPITISHIKDLEVVLDREMSPERQLFSSRSRLDALACLLRLFTGLRSMRGYEVFPQFKKPAYLLPQKDVSKEIETARALAAEMIFIDDILYVPSLGPIARPFFRQDYTYLELLVPDMIEMYQAGSIRNPAYSYYDERKNRAVDGVSINELEILQPSLLRTQAIANADTERFAWWAMHNICSVPIRSFTKTEIEAFRLISNKLKGRALEKGSVPRSNFTLPYPPTYMDYMPSEDISSHLETLKDVVARTTRTSPSYRNEQRMSWFTIPHILEGLDIPELSDVFL